MAHANAVRGIETGLVERISAFVSRLRESRQRYKLYRQTVNELSALTERELSDLGLHRTSIEAVALDAAYGK